MTKLFDANDSYVAITETEDCINKIFSEEAGKKLREVLHRSLITREKDKDDHCPVRI